MSYDIRTRRGPKTVYFIRPIGMRGPVKIGCSSSPTRRRLDLENWSPFPLEIIAEFTDASHEIERRFHAYFLAEHQRREWFNWSPRIDDVVAAINAGTFDAATLPPPMGITARKGGKKVERPEWFSRQMSYALRESHLVRKTGWACPVTVSGIVRRNDLEAIRRVEEFLAAPHVHGVPIKAPWAAECRRKWLAKRKAAA